MPNYGIWELTAIAILVLSPFLISWILPKATAMLIKAVKRELE